MKVKNIKNTTNQDETPSDKPLVEIARQVINEKANKIVLTKNEVKNKVGAHTKTRDGNKGISITSAKNNNPNNHNYYGVRYFVPMSEINKKDKELAKKIKK